jgi:hypothetical protein
MAEKRKSYDGLKKPVKTKTGAASFDLNLPFSLYD